MTDTFYGDAVEKFSAMANSNGGCDEAHFRMWCKIAAEEIQKERDKFAKLSERCSQYLTFLQKSLQVGPSTMQPRKETELLKAIKAAL